MSWDPEMIAAHELGHLIVAKETGHRSNGIRLMTSWWSGEVTSGYCDLRSFRYPVDGSAKDWDLYRGMLLVYAGGQAAAEHWYQLRGQPVEFTAGSDLQFFTEDAPLMPNAPTWEQAQDEARQIIVARWDEVVKLTPGLIADRRLAGGRVA
jgi:hypothetical protein